MMNAFYRREATRLHGTTAPSSGRKLKCPDTGTEGNRGGLVHPASLRLSTDLGPGLIFQVRKTNKEDALTDRHLCSQMRPDEARRGRDDRLIQAILPSETNRYRSTPTNSLQKQGLILNMVRISKHMALLTELFTQVNKTFGTKCMYRNAK